MLKKAILETVLLNSPVLNPNCRLPVCTWLCVCLWNAASLPKLSRKHNFINTYLQQHFSVCVCWVKMSSSAMIAYLRFCLRLRFSRVALHLQSERGREGERRVCSLKTLMGGRSRGGEWRRERMNESERDTECGRRKEKMEEGKTKEEWRTAEGGRTRV